MKPKPTLDDVWERIPHITCKGLCQESCGPIAMSREEDRRLQTHGVTVPSILDALDDLDHYHCPALVDGRCSVYEDRPTICRLWGATTTMPCPWGCTPDNALSDVEGKAVLDAANDAGGGVAVRFFHVRSDGP